MAFAQAALEFTSRGLGVSRTASWVQIDGSDHRRFEDRGERCTLLVFIDDATSRLMQLRFVPSAGSEGRFWDHVARS